MSRLASLRALLRRPRAVSAALLLAVSALATLAGPVHLAFDAALLLHAQDHAGDHAEHGAPGRGHGHAAEAAPRAAFESACPADCADPHHAHRSHDHATCPTCRTFGAAFLVASPLAPAAPERLAPARSSVNARALSRATDSPVARGPPAPLSLVAAS